MDGQTGVADASRTVYPDPHSPYCVMKALIPGQWASKSGENPQFPLTTDFQSDLTLLKNGTFISSILKIMWLCDYVVMPINIQISILVLLQPKTQAQALRKSKPHPLAKIFWAFCTHKKHLLPNTLNMERIRNQHWPKSFEPFSFSSESINVTSQYSYRYPLAKIFWAFFPLQWEY